MNNDRDRYLLVQNFPHSFSDNDIHEFLNVFDVESIEIIHSHRAICAKCLNERHAHNICIILHQYILNGRRLNAFIIDGSSSKIMNLLQKFHSNNQNDRNFPFESSNYHIFDNTLKQLYAIDVELNFNQSPPPYIYYEYPLINEKVISNISNALKLSRKFYVQVLHLMNRMNLLPPFDVNDTMKFEFDKINSKFKSIETQTDESLWNNFLHRKRKRIETDESELESSSSDDEKCIDEKQSNQISTNIEKLSINTRKRIRLSTPITVKANSTTPATIGEAFERPSTTSIGMSSIKINITDRLTGVVDDNSTQAVEIDSIGSTETIHVATEEENSSNVDILTDAEIIEHKIPDNQLNNLPVFINYRSGEPSNRLYIKNIAKDVTENDLRSIYHRYLETYSGCGNVRSIDIRLMQTGRMKGQAFITFDGPYLECDQNGCYEIVHRALCETNGLILKNKPIVVVYGKRKFTNEMEKQL